MAVQEPVLRALSVECSWPLSPRFNDVRGTMTDILLTVMGDDGDWFWGDSSSPYMSTYDEERRLHAFAAPGGLDVVSEKPRQQDAVAGMNAVLGDLLTSLARDHVTGFGANAIWLFPASDLADASAAVESWLFAGPIRDLLSPLGRRMRTGKLDLVFGDDESKSRLQITSADDEALSADGHFLSMFDDDDLPPAAVVMQVSQRRAAKTAVAPALAGMNRLLGQVLEKGRLLGSTMPDIA